MSNELGESKIINRIVTAFQGLGLEEISPDADIETWIWDYPSVRASWGDPDDNISRNVIARLPEGNTGDIHFEVNAWVDFENTSSEGMRKWSHLAIGTSDLELENIEELAGEAFERVSEVERDELEREKSIPPGLITGKTESGTDEFDALFEQVVSAQGDYRSALERIADEMQEMDDLLEKR